MKKLSIKTRLLGGFICVIVLSAIMTVISIFSLSSTQNNYETTINGPIYKMIMQNMSQYLEKHKQI